MLTVNIYLNFQRLSNRPYALQPFSAQQNSLGAYKIPSPWIEHIDELVGILDSTFNVNFEHGVEPVDIQLKIDSQTIFQ